jgi:hypothetical protein
MLAAILVAVAGGPRLLPHEASESPPSPVLARLPRRLLVLGAAEFLTQLAEAAAAVAALGCTSFSPAMAAGRGLADRLDGRFGAVALVRDGSLLAAAGLTVP